MNRLRHLGMGMILLACLFDHSLQADPPASPPKLGRLFSETDPQKRDALKKDILKAAENDPKTLKTWIKTDTDYPDIKPGWHKQTATFLLDKKKITIHYYLFVPTGYTPKKPWPAVIALHGTGGIGKHQGQFTSYLLGTAAKDYLIIAPNLTVKGEPGKPAPFYDGTAYQEQTVLQSLRDAARQISVDMDRVYITGYSQGGHGTWHNSMAFPHHFAAAVSLAGVPFMEGFPYTFINQVGNIRHLPFWSRWGENDFKPKTMGQPHFNRLAMEKLNELGVQEFHGEELKGVGHKNNQPPVGDIAAFFKKHARVKNPEEITHYFTHPRFGRSYYLETLKISRSPKKFGKNTKITMNQKVPQNLSQEDIVKVFAKASLKDTFKLTGNLNPKDNSLHVNGLKLKSVKLHVNEELFDLAKPVTIHYFGRVWKGPVFPSAECMLEHYSQTRDRQLLILNEVLIINRGNAKVMYRTPGKK